MATNNSLANQRPQQAQKPKFSVMIQSDMYKNLINSTLSDKKKSERFIAAISSAVAVNPTLQDCEAGSILTAALLGESLGLSPSPQLGQYYLVPYKKKDKQGNVISVTAQFQLGAKGYKQLAIRSGQYLDIDCIAVHDGEYLGRSKQTGKHMFEFYEDDDIREAKPIIGYLAYFELLNGFKKQLYWTVSKMEKHADTYSQAFSLEDYHRLQRNEIPQKDMWKYSSFWYKNFDEMAEKTMLRQLISKWGIMSIEMQSAVEKDMAVIKEDGQAEYVDNQPIEADFQPTEQQEQPQEQFPQEYDPLG